MSSWVSAGLRTPGYSFTSEPISRLAAFGAPHRPLVTGGLICFGLALPAYAAALRRAVPGPAWKVAVGNGVASLAVAAFPLGGPAAVEVAHGAAALAAYVNLTALPALAARGLRAVGCERAARVSQAAAVVVGACLAASLLGAPVGLFQRAGLTLGDAWIVASAVGILADRMAPRSGSARAG